MRRRYQAVTHKIIIGILVPIISLCITFLLLYISMPHLVVRSEALRDKAPGTAMNVPVPKILAAPVQLKISSIKVDAVIKPTGLTASGDMDIDDNPLELAWYKFGPSPGEIGSAVIAGHYGWKNNVPSIFNNLKNLVKGDEVLVSTESGQEKRFIVTKTALYDPNQDAREVFKSDDGKAHLNLITCQGAWVNAEQTYTKRLVVFTDYVE